jgi:hypothetical protein
MNGMGAMGIPKNLHDSCFFPGSQPWYLARNFNLECEHAAYLKHISMENPAAKYS